MKQSFRDYRLNLASRPFVDTRPAWILLSVLAAAVVVFTIFNAVLLLSAVSGDQESSDRIDTLQAEMDQMRDEITAIDNRLQDMEPGQLNNQITYVNSLIAQRTLSWSLLFGRLEELVPPELKMERISPRSNRGKMELAFRVEVPRQEVIRIFIEALEESDYFSRVVLSSESLDVNGGNMKWELTTLYHEDGEEG